MTEINLPELDIWGSCITREIFNFDSDLKVGCYLSQNPIQTLFKDAYHLYDTDIVSTSNFTKRMSILEFNKNTIQYFYKNFNKSYILIDFADCRYDYYEINGVPNTGVCCSISNVQTLNSLKEKGKLDFNIKHIFDIDSKEWIENLKNFCIVLKSKYKDDHIILNTLY